MHCAAQGVATAMGESGRTSFSKPVENKSKVLTQTWGKECIPLLVVKEPSKCNLYWNKSVWPLLRKHSWTSLVCALSDLMRTDRGNLEFLLNVVMADSVLCWQCLHPWVDTIRSPETLRDSREGRGELHTQYRLYPTSCCTLLITDCEVTWDFIESLHGNNRSPTHISLSKRGDLLWRLQSISRTTGRVAELTWDWIRPSNAIKSRVSPLCFIVLSFHGLTFSMDQVDLMEQQLPRFVNHCAATRREPWDYQGRSWLAPLGSGSFLWLPVSNGKRQNMVHLPSLYTTCEWAKP